MKYEVIEKGHFKYNDFDIHEHPIQELDYEIVKAANSEKHYIRGWHKGISEMTELPLEIYSNIEAHLESELLVVRDLLEAKQISNH